MLPQCMPYRPYLATGAEPLLLNDTVKVSAGIGMRNLLACNYNLAIKAHKKIALTSNGFFSVQITGIDFGALYFKNYKKFGFYAGPYIGFLDNFSISGIPLGFFGYRAGMGSRSNFNYFGSNLGIRISKKKNKEQHITFTMNYNIVNQYGYEVFSDNASGRNSAYEVFDEEHLNYKIPNFYSIQLKYSFIKHIDERLFLKFQAGLLYCEPIFLHNYTYFEKDFNSFEVKASRMHPYYRIANYSFGLVYNFGKSKA